MYHMCKTGEDLLMMSPARQHNQVRIRGRHIRHADRPVAHRLLDIGV